MQPTAKHALSRDTRAPVLWLRAFKDDDIALKQNTNGDELHERSLEDLCSYELWHYGPVIGIGAPGERLPRIGAARGYFEDAQWQAAVRHWMSIARLIVVVVGKAEWLRWEMQTAFLDGHLSKLVFIFPPATQSDRQLRWQNTIAPLNQTPGYESLTAVDVTRARIAHFTKGGSIQFITDDTKDRVVYDLALRLAIYGLFCHHQPPS